MVPPIRLWDQGVPNQAALTIMTRNSRMPDSLAADLDAECAACLMGARRLTELFDGTAARPSRPASTPSWTATTETFRREVLAKIPDGTWVWEDYAEHDGVDEPRLHTQRITLTKTAGRAPHRLHRHEPAGQGADQPLRRLRRRQLPQEVARADPAQPRRHPRADGRARRRRGRRPADRDALPREGDAAHARLPGAGQRPHLRHPAPARRAGRRARQGHRRPACRPTRRRSATPASTAPTTPASRTSCARCSAAAPAAAPTPTARTPIHVVPDSRNLPTSSPRRASRSWSSASASPSTPAVRGSSEAASATTSTSGCCATRRSCRSPTARSWPAGASRAAGPGGRSGRRRPRRAERARARGPGRRRARARRRGRPHPHDRRRRLGRPARRATASRRPRRPLGQGLGRGIRPRRLRRRR